MEDSSHDLIDQMIAKEQYCYGFDNVSSLNTNNTPTVISSQQPQVQFAMVQMGTEIKVEENPQVSSTRHKKEAKNEYSSTQSSASLPSHNQRWSEEEDRALVNAVNVYGYGHWKTISEHVKTRNSLQCKNRARQKIPAPTQKKKPNNKPENTIIIPAPQLAQINFVDSNPPVATYPVPMMHSHQMLATIPEHVPANDTTEPKTDTTEVENVQIVQKEEEEEPPKKQEVECDFDLEGITDHERKENTEWFLGKLAKTPERYKRIRNHIIQCWRNSRPNYLTKTAGRQNLADCGDVNAVGRIHAYLESIKVINVDCTSPVKRTYGRSSHRLEDGSFIRKKKIKKSPGFFWADVDDQDGEFEQPDDIIRGDGKSRPRRTVKKPETFYNENGNESGNGNDPFTLVPVGYYPNQRSAPFTVNITSNALLVMELHSHLAYTEIIGLLGGRVVQNEDGSQHLKVEYVFPCRSTSTGIQCEMDPVSEMAAREVFERKGLNVVGWYHSHPTFEPEPSIRDIENQTSYQDLFRDEVSGVEPFIGVIITPYNSRNIISDRSQFQFIHISKRWNSNKSYRLPFACLQKVTQCESIPSEIVDTVQNLIFEYKTYEHKIDMNLRYGDITRLDKLMRSLKNHLFMSPENNEKFLSDLKQMIEKNFGIESDLITQESPQKQMDRLVHSLAI